MTKTKPSSASKKTSFKEVPISKISHLKSYPVWDPENLPLNKRDILETMLECLLNGDSRGFCNVLQHYLSTTNKSQLANRAKVARKTLYNAIDSNISLKTLFKILQAIKQN